MTQIKLTKNGIFPIKRNYAGELIDDSSNDIAMQGEGKLAGVPSLFIRTSGCDLRCCWHDWDTKTFEICDTAYSSFDIKKSSYYTVEECVNEVRYNMGNINHLVVTGGEPMIHSFPLIEIFEELKSYIPNLHITLETNGTLFDENIVEYVDLFSISPKLQSTEPDVKVLKEYGIILEPRWSISHKNRRINYTILQQLISSCYIDTFCKAKKYNKDFQLKFVVFKEADIIEIKDILSGLIGVNNSDVYLMPLGSTKEMLQKNIQFCLDKCIENNWRYSPRIQVELLK